MKPLLPLKEFQGFRALGPEEPIEVGDRGVCINPDSCYYEELGHPSLCSPVTNKYNKIGKTYAQLVSDGNFNTNYYFYRPIDNVRPRRTAITSFSDPLPLP